jgi:hypothetical protein
MVIIFTRVPGLSHEAFAGRFSSSLKWLMFLGKAENARSGTSRWENAYSRDNI